MKANFLLATTALVASASPALAQQGFNSGGLNTCSTIMNSVLLPLSTCYGYINGTPTFFTQQPSTGNAVLNIDNFVGQVAHNPAPISIDKNGLVSIPSLAPGQFSGTLNAVTMINGDTLVSPFVQTVTSVVYNSPTVAPPPLISLNELNLTGTIGNGGTVIPSNWVMNSWKISDSLKFNNSAQPQLFDILWTFANGTGGRSLGHAQLHQQGPMTQLTGKNASFGGGSYPAWVTMTDNVGGSDLTHTTGLVYGSNPQVVLRPGATYFSLLNAAGEVDLQLDGSQDTISLAGSIVGGGTVCISLASTAASFSENLCTSTLSTDVAGLVLQRLVAAINSDETLLSVGLGPVGAGSSGASSTITNMTIFWPQVIDLTITPTVTAEAGLTITAAPTITGASVQSRYGETFVYESEDSSPGFVSDAVFAIGRQSRDNSSPSGRTRGLFLLGGLAATATPDGDTQFKANSMWPMDPYSDWIKGSTPTGYTGAADGPIPPPRSHSVLNLTNVDFCLSQGGIWFTAGSELFCDGALRVGSGGLSRLVASAGTAGIALGATGWEGTATSLVSGGGPTIPGLLHRYYVGDILMCGTINAAGQSISAGFGDEEMVTAIDGTGAITSYIQIADSAGHVAWPSAVASVSPPPSTCSLIGGSGLNAVLGITWTAANTVQIGQTSDTVALLGAITQSGTAGVSCSGTPTSSFVSVHGIVTHC